MDEFTWIPDWNAQGNTIANVSKIQFGDGYSQRQAKGMNPLTKTWQLTFNTRTDAETAAIKTFLENRYGVTAFTWTPPGESQAKWISSNWNHQKLGFDVNNFSVQFELVYEP